MPNIKIRKATKDDAEAIHGLHTASVRTLCTTHYSPEVINGWLENRSPAGYLNAIARSEIYLAQDQEKILGFGHAVQGEIRAVFIDPAYSKLGIGTMLANYGLERAWAEGVKEIKIEATLNAKTFYNKLGFEVLRELKVERNSVVIDIVEMVLRGK